MATVQPQPWLRALITTTNNNNTLFLKTYEENVKIANFTCSMHTALY
jgi:hypothetical protein